jgi:hypothetical protein
MEHRSNDVRRYQPPWSGSWDELPTTRDATEDKCPAPPAPRVSPVPASRSCAAMSPMGISVCRKVNTCAIAGIRVPGAIGNRSPQELAHQRSSRRRRIAIRCEPAAAGMHGDHALKPHGLIPGRTATSLTETNEKLSRIKRTLRSVGRRAGPAGVERIPADRASHVAGRRAEGLRLGGHSFRADCGRSVRRTPTPADQAEGLDPSSGWKVPASVCRVDPRLPRSTWE